MVPDEMEGVDGHVRVTVQDALPAVRRFQTIVSQPRRGGTKAKAKSSEVLTFSG